MRAISRSVCKNVVENFELRLKKCTELNGGLEKMLWNTQEQADRHHTLSLHLEHNKVVVSAFSSNLNGNLRKGAHRKLGPVFLGHPVFKRNTVSFFLLMKNIKISLL